MSHQPDGIVRGDDGIERCWWCVDDPLYLTYHDDEWGRPSSDDARLFEKLCLEGFQSGLSWLTILRKRDNFRRAFRGFDLESIARFGPAEIEALMADEGIVRNRAKIEATITNARRYADLVDEFGSLAAYVWRFEPSAAARPPVVDHSALMQIKFSPEAKAMSNDLRRRGWAFVGPTTVYSFMEAMGIVNDHLEGCAFRGVVEDARAAFARPASASRQ
jgi:DNA-3-methyladenine glycosylase I